MEPGAGAGGAPGRDSCSDEGTGSLSCGEGEGEGEDSPGPHRRGEGSFSSTASSLSERSLSAGYASRDEEEEGEGEPAGQGKRKGFSGFFSRGVFPWKSSGSVQKNPDTTKTSTNTVGVSWRLFGSKSSNNLTSASKTLATESQGSLTPSSSGANTPHHHRRQGSSASEKQFEDLVASSIALIQHDRPSNLPAKCTEEALRHRQEHARMVEAARRRGEREAAARRARMHEALRQEEQLTRHAKEWNTTILNNWESMKYSKRTQELWWSGLPPSIRGKVWQLAIDNKLNITLDMYHDCVARAKQRLHEAQLRRKRLKMNSQTCMNCKRKGHSSEKCLGDDANENETRALENGISDKDSDRASEHRLAPVQSGLHRNFSEQNLKSLHIEKGPCRKTSKSNPNLLEYGDECSMELIQLDIARTFPHLCIFQPGGPYFDVLHELLAAYVCYRPDIGYVQGMSFIGAMLILNMEAPQAFVCFANLLEGPVLRAAYTRDGATMQRLWEAYSSLLQRTLPALAGRVAPELYLLEWIYTAFAKAMPLDAACRVWDLLLRDTDAFLFKTALGVLHLYQEDLKDLDFISAAQFLTKLPEDLSPDALFRSISSIDMTLDGRTFEQLVTDVTQDKVPL